MNLESEFEAKVGLLQKVRGVCDDFQSRGLDTFPDGIPFTFWEQYLHLQWNLFVALAIVIGAVSAVVTILLCSPWTAVIVVSQLTVPTWRVIRARDRNPKASSLYLVIVL